MKNLILFGLFTIVSTLCGQNVRVVNDTVYMDNQSIGTIKHIKESFMSVNGGSVVERTAVLYTFNFLPKETIGVVKNELSNKFDNFEVRQNSNNTLYRSGQSLKLASMYQMVGLVGVPLSFINPFVGGAVTLVGFIGSISEMNKSGQILMGEL